MLATDNVTQFAAVFSRMNEFAKREWKGCKIRY